MPLAVACEHGGSYQLAGIWPSVASAEWASSLRGLGSEELQRYTGRTNPLIFYGSWMLQRVWPVLVACSDPYPD